MSIHSRHRDEQLKTFMQFELEKPSYNCSITDKITLIKGPSGTNDIILDSFFTGL